MTNNLPFDEWTSVICSERLTGALLDLVDQSHAHHGNGRRKAHSILAVSKSAADSFMLAESSAEGPYQPNPLHKLREKIDPFTDKGRQLLSKRFCCHLPSVIA